MVLLALDLHLVHLGMISIIPPAWRQGPWRLHLGCHPILQYITWIYLQHAGHKRIRKNNHLAPAGCYNFTNKIISYIKYVIYQNCNIDHITSQALQKQIRRL